jgi:hypothetical protein
MNGLPYGHFHAFLGKEGLDQYVEQKSKCSKQK